jgi:hypothetical protein
MRLSNVAIRMAYELLGKEDPLTARRMVQPKVLLQ